MSDFSSESQNLPFDQNGKVRRPGLRKRKADGSYEFGDDNLNMDDGWSKSSSFGELPVRRVTSCSFC